MSTLKLKSYEHETNNIVACLGRTAVRSSNTRPGVDRLPTSAICESERKM